MDVTSLVHFWSHMFFIWIHSGLRKWWFSMIYFVTYHVFSLFFGQNIKEQYWCIHCPHLWAQFLTVVEALDNDVSKRRNTLKRTSLSLYRQSILEPIPLTVWVSLRFPSSVPIDPVQPGMQLIIDLDCSVNPLDTGRRGFTGHLNQAEPISLFLGAIPPANGRFCLLPTRNRRLPDALDHLLFLCNLANQLSRVKDQLGLDLNRISGVLNNPDQIFCSSMPRLLYTLKFVIQKRLQLNLVSPWSSDTFSRSGHKLYSPMDELDSSKLDHDDQSYIRGQSTENPERSNRDFPESSFLAVKETPQSRTQVNDSINLKNKNNSFFALMAKVSLPMLHKADHSILLLVFTFPLPIQHYLSLTS